jgi:hypothetical protein
MTIRTRSRKRSLRLQVASTGWTCRWTGLSELQERPGPTDEWAVSFYNLFKTIDLVEQESQPNI